MHRTFIACSVVSIAVGILCSRPVSAQDWHRFDEAASVVSAVDTSIVLDLALLERVRSGLARSRMEFPQLREIRDEETGTVLYLPALLFPTDVWQRLSRLSGARARRGHGGLWMEIPSTGYARVDSLNRRFGASRVRLAIDSVTRAPLLTVAVEFARPTNVARLERIYEAAGVRTASLLRHLWPGGHAGIRWRPGRESDRFEFVRSSACITWCRREERYLVRVPRGAGRPEMLDAVVRTTPD